MLSQHEEDEILMALVESALAKPAGERETYLRSACSPHPHLFDEALSRIESEEQMGSFLRDPIIRLSNIPGFAAVGPDTSIGHFKIKAKLGAGGMGEVWRAMDTKLNRDVAVKVIPESLAGDRDRMARFEREARVVASLNHPNIAAIYGVEERALVLELVEGENLAGPVPVEQAMPLILQLIDALEWAHERGVVHRDLKPANIKVTPEGRIKVLDFGLAKAMSDTPVTLASNAGGSLTEPGFVIGSPAYMAPEQARGLGVDKRADIWAFGVVVYEMLTGRRLFFGETVSDVLSQVLTKELDLSAVPPRFRVLLRHCLERDARKRLRDIGDARVLLQDAVAVETQAKPRRVWPVLATVFALMAVIFAALWIRTSPAPAPLFHFTVASRGRTYLSPDGRYLLESQPAGLRVRSMEHTAWKSLPQSEGAAHPFWSADSSSVGFFTGGRLRISSISGGNPQDLAAAPEATGGAWRGGSSDGTILFIAASGFHAYDLSSGQMRDLPLKLAKGEQALKPSFLPEGDGFVYLVEAEEKAHLFRASLSSTNPAGTMMLETRRRATFGKNPHTGQWYVFYLSPEQQASGRSGATLFARPIHPREGTLTGPPIQVLDSLKRPVQDRYGAFDVSPSGAIVWQWTATSQPVWRIRWFDMKGVVTGAVGDLGMYVSLALAPDESKVAVLQGSPTEHVWVYDLRNGTAGRVSTNAGFEGPPVWSPDSRTLYYTVGADGSMQVVRQEIASGGSPEVLYEDRGRRPIFLQDITPDGKSLILVRRGREAEAGIYRLNLTDGQTPRVLEKVLSNGDATLVRIAPDGRSMLFVTPRGSFVSRYPAREDSPRSIGSFRGGSYPFFSRDGRTLYFIEQRSVISQPVLPAPDGGFRLGDRTVLFPIITGQRTIANMGAVSRDGSRLLAISTDDDEDLSTHVHSDWTALVKGQAQVR